MSSAALKTRYLDLPPISPGVKPAFVDVVAARRWIEELPMENPHASNDLLLKQLTLLTAADLPPDRRLEILDALRPRTIALQHEHARKYRGKPAPLLPHRRDTLNEVCAVWEALSRGYQRCLDTWARNEKSPPAPQAPALQRAIDATARTVLDYYYAYVAPPAAVYRMLHRLYSFGERSGLTSLRVRDPLADLLDVSPRNAYARALLFDAALPREHRPHVLAAIFRMLSSWTEKIAIRQIGDPIANEVPPLFVDLNRERGLRQSPETGPSARVFDVGSLSAIIHDGLHALRHGRMPTDSDGAGDLSRRELETLLIGLHRQWCEGPVKRQFERQPIEALAHVSTGLVASHFYLSRQPFRQPFQPATLPSGQGKNFDEATGDRVKAATSYLLDRNILAEQWLVRDESLTGIGLIRPQAENSEAWLAHGLLIAVRRRGGSNALVGTIQWLEEAKEGDLHVGVRLLPGVPFAISARGIGDASFVPAILLTPLPALAAPSSLVLPPGMFTPHRVIEIFRQGVDRVELTALLETSADFERVAFMPAGSVYVPDEVEAVA